ncbi:hypothetical protein A2W54_01320 [Candidatus Giovannonibacteria bacterium RIFCSPHIGHO2_02_43_13]|uniref:Serine protease n=1 Tax=Candidatus Giovannonibacteria bacterium RIFCSPHIGHO2_02_43_13 TaxID=1798330 RepID=A0A1F5WUM7_9BACT|nr:MAG: hypothetical protein UW28_C0001G0022 [Parcubacteria group bacterium GW2011_GWA2_44_13]OGF72960.1 MAG: hypothetical protein A3E06_03195 [Candidatus Giovannonibacteria bacterium RIFCSPHIGHO2_12_FULL_44_42]OGF79355.1 MAG: hypothetical protein A2W54_01320 [Candidatus Giovannonibacteria bacterium RIFCSPHIGHO2_02_43_13]OGF90402.1 MAG: hypothetical protein A3I94_00555 [Candidatus Giovannonibacteria bacterium RIFCSPLOWO2_02_FULL_43_54]OGF97214.1 MAG: hypothetical protein A3H08_03595 [Candidatus
MAMKKRLFAVLFLLVCSVAYASPLGDIIRNIDAASAKIFNFCTYNIEYKDGAKKGPEKVAGRYVGNAVFIEYPGSSHLALTNKHILKCAAETEDIKGYMPGENIDGIESFTSTSSLKIKWGSQLLNTALAGMPVNGNQDIDLAILEVKWPQKSPTHGRMKVLTDETAYDLGNEVIVRGFMPCGEGSLCDDDGWVRRLKFARVEGITADKLFVQLNTPGYGGMSGSPVMILKNNKLYVIGIFSVAYLTSRYGSVDMSWAVRLKKEYFNKKKKP